MQLVPRGLQNFMEVIVEGLMGLIEQTAGPKGRAFAPVVMTAFLFILAANWIGTMPFFGNINGFESPNSNLNITACDGDHRVHARASSSRSRRTAIGGLPQGVRRSRTRSTS